jgi:DNA-directed RNA polymerase specialized sigma24 family protein
VVIRDAYNNKLANKLAVAVKHDVIDEIRKIVSKKHDFRITESLYYTTGDGDETMLPVSDPELTPGEITEDKNSYDEILNLLSPEESSLVILLTEGYSKKESAVILGHTASWATKKLQSIQKRLIPLLNTN